MRPIAFLILGTVFGWTLSRSGAADYNYVQKMFLFEDIQLWGIIATAVILTAPGVWWLKRRGRAALGDSIVVQPKVLHPGNVVGGLIFGAGWSITGMCPGPIFVNIGEGKLYALAALAGALTGAAIYGSTLRRPLTRLLRLPA
ncbi:MAG: YeeE/YedE family protein [Phycisphaerae bacterium]|nr:YeeE/YedE family protein [Phycisphaerae bacterium]NNF44099.1 YeeE/YedE family protein [Phycisphaerales bacterium]